jgi:hypothetical protein
MRFNLSNIIFICLLSISQNYVKIIQFSKYVIRIHDNFNIKAHAMIFIQKHKERVIN